MSENIINIIGAGKKIPLGAAIAGWFSASAVLVAILAYYLPALSKVDALESRVDRISVLVQTTRTDQVAYQINDSKEKGVMNGKLDTLILLIQNQSK